MFRPTIAVAVAILLAAVLPHIAYAQQSADATTTTSNGQTFLAFEVDQPVRIKTSASPAYPATLRAAGVDGQVVAQFVVDENGNVQMSTFKVLQSSHEAFTQSVKRAVKDMTFTPAEAGGRKVRQLVQQPFKFAASR